MRLAYLDIIIVDARNEVAPINYSDFLYDIQHSQSSFFAFHSGKQFNGFQAFQASVDNGIEWILRRGGSRTKH